MSSLRRVGLLGGSFNPAHEGHLYISEAALKMLGLDEVWWLVSPQNPLKPAEGMADYERRLAAAEKIAAGNRRVHVSDAESRLGTRYTADTLARLSDMQGEYRFVWLMGADNLLQIHRWRDWSRIFRIVPVAVFGRPGYSLRATSSVAARRFARDRWPQAAAKRLADADLPAWVFLKIREHPLSATRIRAEGGF
ncbi:MAG: nicotinate-nucleotide adenylyltransferase [Rhodospirillales bacterium]|nr:nicotinate-nucleotide adenylyltransferase [Rhodospirillales bacterium]MBO6785571.1 nicotinate-nucleotide adenylyltransferase [Rhodospirillales bacterium]